MSLVSTNWLLKNLNNVKIIECSWHMPNANRDSYKEYLKEHIENAIFFDLDKNSEQNSDLPHMLPDKNVISSCRCWYCFIYFGHSPNLVHVLDGGMKKWKLENKPLTSIFSKNKISKYVVEEKKELVKNKFQIDQNILNKKFKVVDARSVERFNGNEPEPRKGLKSGSIPNSFCLPFKLLINKDNTFKNSEEITNKFNNVLKDNKSSDVVFSCGSGVTAAGLAFAAYRLGFSDIKVYDGSWVEWGSHKKTPIETN